MSLVGGLFGSGKKKTPIEVVKGTLPLLQTLEEKEPDSDKGHLQTKEKISTNLRTMRFMFYGDTESDPKQETMDKLAQEILENDLLPPLLKHIKDLEFEARKDVAAIFNFLLRRGSENSAEKYFLAHTEILDSLVSGYDDVEIALNCGAILRECIRHESLCKKILEEQKYFYPFFDLVQKSSFDVAADAFTTLKQLLTKHKNIAAEFLQSHYDKFFEKYNELIQSKNYVTMRQSLKLLGEILLDRKNFNVMIRYINDAENLKIMMILLRGKSKTIQFEAFHVFKVFVANPEKSKPVLDILMRNRNKLIEFLQGFQKDRGKIEQ